MSDPYHPGERAIQTRVDERDAALLNARGIGARIPKGAIRWLARQQLCILGAADRSGCLWAAVLAGAPGFVEADDGGSVLRLQLADETGMSSGTPPLPDLRVGAHLGMLVIDLDKRRRLRVNGRLSEIAEGSITVAVEQAYANCPKYIQRRQILQDDGPAPGEIESGAMLTEPLRQWIAKADTLFVASAHPDGPADASHRGGRPGFVRLRGEQLEIPDYAGNSMFNTFGNLALNPRAGLTFLDFEASRQLQLTGEARLDLDADGQAGEPSNTLRSWRFTPSRWVISPLNLPIRWRFVEPSPFNL